MTTTSPRANARSPRGNWRQLLRERVPFFGHRNWIVVADSAYPAQSREGIETIVSNAGQLEVLREVVAVLAKSGHVKPRVLVDQELDFVQEEDSPGITAYRRHLSGVLQESSMERLPHEQIIALLDQASQTFRVLIIKTRMSIAYTSVFLQLDCGYWDSDAEKRLRAAMQKG